VDIGIIDIAILLTLLIGCVRGSMIGFVRQTTDMAGIILTVILAIALTRPVGVMIESYTGWPHGAALATSFLGILLAVKLGTAILAKSADGAVDALHLSSANRAAGVLFSVFKAGLLLSGLFLILNLANWPDPNVRKQSRLYEPVAGLLPDTWTYLSGKAPILNEYKDKIENGAREGVGKLGEQVPSDIRTP
jgi:uncharacterized membrane protein required for colicin V production